MRTRFLSRSLSRLAIFAVVVVLPEPCSPTIRSGTGAAALRSMPPSSLPERLDELVMDDLDHHLPGRHRADDLLADGPGPHPCRRSCARHRAPHRLRSAPVAPPASRFRHRPSDRLPRPVSLSKIPASRSCKVSNMSSLGCRCPSAKRTRGRTSLAGVGPSPPDAVGASCVKRPESVQALAG